MRDHKWRQGPLLAPLSLSSVTWLPKPIEAWCKDRNSYIFKRSRICAKKRAIRDNITYITQFISDLLSLVKSSSFHFKKMHLKHMQTLIIGVSLCALLFTG